MKPVRQTRHGDDGNCIEACVATIFDLPLQGIPDFEGNPVGRTAATWFRREGFLPVVVGSPDIFDCAGHHRYGIAITGATPAFDHAVVYECDGGTWKPVHDPDRLEPLPSYNVRAICVLLIR